LLDEVVKKLNKGLKDDKMHASENDTKAVVINIETLVNKMILYGINDKEQIRFMNSLALAVSGGYLSEANIKHLTGLPRRALEVGKVMRKQFEDEVILAENEIIAQDAAVVPDDGHSDNDHDVEVAEYSHSDPVVDNHNDANEIIPWKRKRSNRGEGTRRKTNRFQIHFTCKAGDVRYDNIDGDVIQDFLHYSPWGGRVDTANLFRQ
jgi:hypothetical protein